MTFLHNIRIVALYEARTLRRSWFFRLFSVMAIIFLAFFNIGLFSPIGDEPWELVSIPSSVPLVNLYLLNIGQAIVVIFLAADFLKRDKKLDTNEVLYTRSMSNFEYVIGKTWGILRLFLGLNIVILSLGLLMNIISKQMRVDLLPYLYYLLIISIPTLVFSLGLAFLLMSAIRNQAVTFLFLLGIAALDMFWLWFRAGFIFDYMAFGIPVFRSGIIGFDNPEFIINQRLLYFSLGIVMIMATVLLFKRLPQSGILRIVTVVLMTLFLTVSIKCALNVWSMHRNDLNEKAQVIETNKQFENSDYATITHESIDLVHNGSSYEAVARIKIINNNSKELTEYLFSLNPSLSVSGVTSGGRPLNLKTSGHIIQVDPGRVLLPGQTDSLEISYSGSISESFCYPDYTGNLKDNPYRMTMLNVNKRQAFLTGDYVLLTPQTHWYPVAGLNYYPSNPSTIKTDFINFNLKVRPLNGLTAVSQGRMERENGSFKFDSETPLTGLTLAIGNYKPDTLVVDSTRYIAFHFPGHDYYKKDLAELRDTVSLLVSGIMRELETSFSIKYPFSSLILVEVPVQFHSHPSKNTQTRAEVQPSMILLPEKLSSLNNGNFYKRFTREKKRMARQKQVISDKELQVRIFNNFVRNTFISGQNFRFVNGVPVNEPVRYRLGPSFYFFRNNFRSDEYPVINSVFESHLQKLPIIQRPGFQTAGITDNDRANLVLKDMSFRNIISANRGGDTLRIVVAAKGDYLFNLLRAKAGVEEFRNWFLKYLDDNKFRSIDILRLNEDINKNFGFTFYPYLDEWFDTKKQAGFIFDDLQVTTVVVNGRVRFQVTFIATNPEPVMGIFNVSFRMGGPGQGPGGQQRIMRGGPGGQFNISMQGTGMEAADISKIVLMEPYESKKIGIVLDRQPRVMMVNTLIAKNIPGEITLPFGDLLKSKVASSDFTGEIKLEPMQELNEKSEIIVDNEDPGFMKGTVTTESRLKKLLRITNNSGMLYRNVNAMNPPDHWQPAVQSTYYGKYILSAVFTRGGTGEKKVSWSTGIDEPGFYDIYTYIGKVQRRIMVTGGPRGPAGQGEPVAPGGTGNIPGRRDRENPFRDMHFEIYHDEGVEEITIDYLNAESGWNNLGSYYISGDSAKVVLTNKSSGRVVIGDAVKWVKKN